MKAEIKHWEYGYHARPYDFSMKCRNQVGKVEVRQYIWVVWFRDRMYDLVTWGHSWPFFPAQGLLKMMDHRD